MKCCLSLGKNDSCWNISFNSHFQYLESEHPLSASTKLHFRCTSCRKCSAVSQFNLLVAGCVSQDFEALTPNLLARTVETVEGGGLVLLLLKSVTSLRQLYTMSMVGAWPVRPILLPVYLSAAAWLSSGF